jgi:hypothetical protein
VVGGNIVHSAGALSDRVGAALGEDPVSAGTATSHRPLPLKDQYLSSMIGAGGVVTLAFLG